jgi:hypothetical protein
MSPLVLRTLGAVLMLPAALAAAQSPSPDEFAWRAPLQLPEGASLVRVELPAPALAKLQSADARDVRVFNAAGDPVPHAWITPATAAAKPLEDKTRSYPALPLYTTTAASPPRGAVQVQISGERGRESVWVHLDGEPAAGARRLNAVLFATREERQPLAAVDVQAQLPANTPVRIRVSTSPDLATWTPAPVRGRLFRFEGDGAPANLRLEFNPPLALRERYLRLDWDAQDDVAITAVTGLRVPAAPAPKRVRIELPPWHETEAGTADIVTGFATPLAAVVLAAPRDNTLVPVRVFGRNDNAQPWRPLGQTVVYRLGNNGETMTNPPLELQGASARSLRIVATHGTTLAPAQLQVFAEFAPLQLVFVASGRGPFVLAAGRERSDAAALPMSTITGMLGERRIEDLPAAEVGAATEAQPGRWNSLWPGTAGKPLMLWAVLGLGVLLLAAVAWSLLKQLNQGGRD